MEALHIDREELHRSYDLLNVGICLVKADIEGTILFANQGLISMYDCASEEAFLSYTSGLFSGMYTGDTILLSHQTEVFHFRFFTAKRHMRTADVRMKQVLVDDEVCYLLEVENQRLMQSDLAEDHLTGFPCAQDFYQRALKTAMERMKAGTFEELCPVCFNIANFRGFNRENGVNAGDRCIAYTGTVLRRIFPDGFFTRTAADHFLGLVNRKDIHEKLDHACSLMNLYLGRRSYTLKAGVVMFEHAVDEETVQHSFDMAQIACDNVKNDGEHSYAIFTQQMEEQLEMRRYILDHIDQALEEGYIKIYYQPVVRALSNKVSSCEALSRWEDPKKGMIPPGVFVPVLESARKIGRLDQYMIEHVVRYQHAILESGRRAVPVSLNLSQLDFDLIQPLKCLNEMTDRYHVPHSYLHVEITEKVLAENQDRMVRMIENFHADGYEVWLDDFGSGYSSLKSLSRFSFDLIKLDLGFFKDFAAQNQEVAASIVLMAKRLGMHTLAEGVENQEQIDYLKRIGCERFQGFFYGRPLPGYAIRNELNQAGLELESGLESSIYNKAGLVDLLSEDPACLFLMENGTARLLAYSETLKREVMDMGIAAALDTVREMSTQKTPKHRHFVRFLEGVFDHGQGTETFNENGAVMRLQASFVAGVRDFWVGKVHLTNISTDEISIQRQDVLMRSALLLFDGVYRLDLEKDQIEVAACVHSQVKLGTVYHGIRQSFLTYCHDMVHTLDQQRFLDYIDTDHLLGEAERSEYGYVQELFRIRRDDGVFRWTLFIAVPVKTDGHSGLLLYERQSVFEKHRDRRAILESYATSLEPHLFRMRDQDEQNAKASSVLRAFFRCAGIPMFWKDVRGRYAGLNDELLTWFGRETKEEVLGRTPQELGALIDAEEFHQVQKRVLERGETVYYSPVLAAGGTSRMMPVTVFPWYDGNQIGGTAGFIHVWEKEKRDLFAKDVVTGLLGVSGAYMAGHAYDAAYRSGAQEYEVLYLALHDAAHVSRMYGTDFFNRVVRAIADRIRASSLPEGATAAHLLGCRFILIGRQAYGQMLFDAARQVQQDVQRMDELDGVACHLTLDLSLAYGSEATGFGSLLRLLEERSSKESIAVDEIKELEDLRRCLTLSPTLLDSSPERIMIVDTENHDLLFINKTLKRDLHLLEDSSFEGRKCYAMLQGRDTPCDFCPNSTLPSDRFVNRLEKFLVNGETYNTREVLIRWQGRAARLTMGTPVSDNIGEARLNDLLNDEIWSNQVITTGMAEKDPDVGIAKSVNQIGWSLQSERLLIFEERDDGTICCTYEWCSRGQMPVKQELQSVLLSKLTPLYRLLQDNKIVTIEDYAKHCRQNPDFWLPLEGIRNFISGHLMISGRSIGFSLVVNVNDEAFHRVGYVLYTLTDFISVMIQNRDNLAAVVARSEQDPMTGLGNRAGLTAYIKARQPAEKVTLIMGDVNGLKETNDTKGHLAGDALLCRIADVLVKNADQEHVFRMGGDEFLVIREGMDETGARQLIQNIKDMCHSQEMSISLGYAVHQGSLDDIDEVLKIADKSMYEDKGRHYHRRWSDRHHEQSSEAF